MTTVRMIEWKMDIKVGKERLISRDWEENSNVWSGCFFYNSKSTSLYEVSFNDGSSRISEVYGESKMDN